MTSTADQITVKHWDRMSRLKAWTGAIGAKQIQREADRQEKSLQAEEQAARAALWKSAAPTSGETEVGHTILGDVIGHAQPPQQPRGGGLKAMLLGAGLTAIGGPIAAAAGLYMYDKLTDESAVVQPIGTDTDTRVRLSLTKDGK